MEPEYLPAVEIEPARTPRSAVVWLHGLGADGHDFEPIVPHLGLDPGLGVRFVFPHAPARPVTLNGGMVMPAWYDISDLDLRRRQDEEGILASSRAATRLLEREEARGVPSHRIVLAGFSQGGAIAIHAGLRFPRPLAGLLLLSTYLVGETVGSPVPPRSSPLPIWQAHGLHDPMVPIRGGELARDRLRELGFEVSWHAYPMMHEVCMEEVEAIGGWLGQVLADTDTAP
jgi:phospholipase/carboxylesterase